MLTGMFNDRESAEKAYKSLSERGYSKDDINLMMTDETRKKYFNDTDHNTELGDKAMEKAGVGSAIGGTLGAIVAAVAAIGTTLAIPGLGLLVAGPVAAAFAGAGAGGLTGGLIGALVGAGIPEDRAKEYESGLKNGGIVMGINPKDETDAEYLSEDWKKNSGQNIHY